MASATLLSPNGIKFRTGSSRRFIVCSENRNGTVYIRYRTNDYDRAYGSCMYAEFIVDTVDKTVVYARPGVGEVNR